MTPSRTVQWKRLTFAFITLALVAPLAGCASLAKGVTEAIIGEPGNKEETRKCYVRGRPVTGLQSALLQQEQSALAGKADRPVLKVLMVHGIGSHQPGYSTRLSENLAKALSLNRVQEKVKEISITHKLMPNQELGVLRFTRFLNVAGNREMIFAELTWNPIVEKEKQIIGFDNSGEYAFRRAPINNTLKEFVNNTIPDVLMYNGTSRLKIQISVTQSFCWLMSEGWASLPSRATAFCDWSAPTSFDRINDDFVFITHSLGSRITVDALQWTASVLGNVTKANGANIDMSKMSQITQAVAVPTDTDIRAATEIKRRLQEKEFTVFMLSNQLPLLQVGQSKPEVTGQISDFCGQGAPHEDERIFRETKFIAFSDPNDLFSYALPPSFLDEYVDSRLCPTLTNVIINVADVQNVFGGEFANPLTAHTEYDNDKRIIGLLTKGIGSGVTDPAVADRCTWLETVP
jgi:hypothetical protein